MPVALDEQCGCDPQPCPECCAVQTGCCDGTIPTNLTLTVTRTVGGATLIVPITWNGTYWVGSAEMDSYLGLDTTSTFTLGCDGGAVVWFLSVATDGYPTFNPSPPSPPLCPPDDPFYILFRIDAGDPGFPGSGTGLEHTFEVEE